MKVEEKTNCRLCDAGELRTVVPLRPLPVASPNVGARALLRETAAADVRQCGVCGFLQIATVVDPALQYGRFRYTTGLSLGLREHFRDLVERLAERGEVGADTFVLDIGSNDGSLLEFAKARGARVLGVDPATAIAEAATDSGIPTIADFFSEALGQAIARDHGSADLVVAANTLANIDDLHDFFAGVRAAVAPGGLVVVETQYAPDILRNTLLDVIYHEHLSYFAVRPLLSFLPSAGFELFDAERIAPKGGSIRLHLQPAGAGRPVSAAVADLVAGEEAQGLYEPGGFAAFNAAIRDIGEALRDRLARSRERTGRALAYGASVGCAALIHYLELSDLIDALFDDAPLVNYLQGADHLIPVLSGAQLENEAPTDVAVLAWRYAADIARNHAGFVEAGGSFYAVLPELQPVWG